jgi:glycosyltransferase involved in cell wall biosynthesis
VKVLVIAPSLRNTSPGSRFRVEQWMEHWAREGVESTYAAFEDEALHEVIYTRGNRLRKATQMLAAYGRRLRLLPSLSRYDVAFIYEEASRIGPALVEWLLTRRLPLLYDFCDPVYLPYKSPTNSYLSYLKFFGKTADICRMARQVTVGNEELAGYARRYSDAVTVVPITIDTEQYRLRPVDDGVGAPTLGWSGSHTTVPHLQGLSGALRTLRKNRDFCLVTIGAPDHRIDGVTVEARPWRAASEVEDLSRIDIGIMPLPGDPWTRLRSHLKVRQYMGLGIPCVVSPVGVNCELISDGENGFLARNDEEWIEKLTRLVDDPALRRKLGAAGRRTIEERYSAQRWAPRVLDLLRQAASGG